MTRRLRRPGPRVYSYSAPEAVTTVLPVVPQAAPRRELQWRPVLVAALVGLPLGFLMAIGGLVVVVMLVPGVFV